MRERRRPQSSPRVAARSFAEKLALDQMPACLAAQVGDAMSALRDVERGAEADECTVGCLGVHGLADG